MSSFFKSILESWCNCNFIFPHRGRNFIHSGAFPIEELLFVAEEEVIFRSCEIQSRQQWRRCDTTIAKLKFSTLPASMRISRNLWTRSKVVNLKSVPVVCPKTYKCWTSESSWVCAFGIKVDWFSGWRWSKIFLMQCSGMCRNWLSDCVVF